MKKIQRDWDEFFTASVGIGQQARKIYTSFVLLNTVSILFSIGSTRQPTADSTIRTSKEGNAVAV